ncbi:ImmA/IrrE family metallo-endopeptidase [Micromonospora sp. B11E3]|uniref:ImmA/IrrE family metallo-endopeptidase n=1 Tax=Micromonospora sp. B11E3 TaxID=3153562 RepID=UPI00325D02E7
MKTRRDAEQAAGELLRKHALGILPIPVEEIAHLEGAQVIRQRFDGNQSGFMYRDGTEKIIGINTLSGRRRQRFTIAHEIGHMQLHQSDPLVVDREINWRDGRSSMGVDLKEIQANAFAAALLMPEEQILEQMQEELSGPAISSRDRLISRLATTFDVSAEAMSYRLINLGFYS